MNYNIFASDFTYYKIRQYSVTMLTLNSIIDVVEMVQSFKAEQNVTTHNMEGRTYVEFKIIDHMKVSDFIYLFEV